MAVDFITLTDLVNESVNIILNDTDISTFCTTNYGDDIYIYNGMDLSNLPGEGNTPYVIIFKDAERIGESVANYRYELGFQVTIEDDNVDSSTPRVEKQLGEERVEELTLLIYDALRREMPCNGNVDDAEIMIDNSQHPLYTGMMVIGFNIPKPIGSSVIL